MIPTWQKLDVFADVFVIAPPSVFPHPLLWKLSTFMRDFHVRLSCTEGLVNMTPSGSYWIIKSHSITKILQKHLQVHQNSLRILGCIISKITAMCNRYTQVKKKPSSEDISAQMKCSTNSHREN